MSGWSRHEGTGAALAADGRPTDNIDTDQLIPARFMSTPRAEGYGRFLLHDQRFDAGGAAVGAHPLTRHPGATVLVAGRNFGAGSSREAAVYALVDFGVRAVVAPSFGDIFAANAVNNGLAPARVGPEIAEAMAARLGPDAAPAVVDLAALSVQVADVSAPFELDPLWREKLIQGWDDVDLTRARAEQIQAFRAQRAKQRPWLFP